MFETYVDVICNLPLTSSLTYRVPTGLIDSVCIGQRVLVLLRNREEVAIIISIHKDDPGFKTHDVTKILDATAIVTSEQLKLGSWMADYYLSSQGQSVFKMFPKYSKWPTKKSNILEADFKPDHTLNKDQHNAFSSIKQGLDDSKFQLHLLHGITGSGKTEIYIHAIMHALSKGGSALLIVPEITLTVQLVERLRCVFAQTLAVLHSGLTAKERFLAYVGVLEGRQKIVVGTRSAIFAPLKNLSLIIIDEEHDNSFKEHSSPRYDARQVAIKRAMTTHIVVVLGSATPRIESYYQICKNPTENFFYHRLETRATGASLANIEILKQGKQDIPITGKMVQAIESNFKKGEKTLLLLNRRGYNPTVLCSGCEEIEKCPFCAVSMNLHKNGKLICHYCSFTRRYDGLCSCSKKAMLKPMGSGTQKLEEYLLNLMPTLRLERLDTDKARKRGFAQESIQRLLDGELDVLIGTQMIAKGLDVPDVTLVGVLQADASLSMPDFRATERTFSLLTQVAGRSGRGKSAGRVILECMQVDDPVVVMAAKQDYIAFSEQELVIRKQMQYPPFCRMIRLLARGKSENRVEKAIETISTQIHREFSHEMESHQHLFLSLGPVHAPLEKLHDQYRHHIILKVGNIENLKPRLRSILDELSTTGVYIEIDIDPVDML